MRVRTRITLLFTLIVLAVLVIVCGSIYYFSFYNRIKNSQFRLVNFAVTTGSLLSHAESFDHSLLQKIDSSTTVALVNKTVQVYNAANIKVYAYSDMPKDSIVIDMVKLEAARKKGSLYFTVSNREVVVYHYQKNSFDALIAVAATDRDGNTALQQLRFILWGSFLFGLLIAAAGGYIFSASLLKPVKKIADEVNEISAQNLARRIMTDAARDEWSYLTDTLNELLNRLQQSFEIQGRFIANASHELSTPLSSISSQLEVSLQRERDANDYRRVMQSVYEDVLQLNKLTQTLLEFAKASGTAAGLDITPVRIDEILLQLKSDLAKIDKDYSVRLDFTCLPEAEDQLLVMGNEALLLTAIKNILVNACKYSQGKPPTVKLQVEQAEIVIDISDEGRGIDAKDLEQIFQPFYRSPDDKHIKGAGLGLTLARRIIKLHKGTIMVSSALNVGSRFTVRLPAAASDANSNVYLMPG